MSTSPIGGPSSPSTTGFDDPLDGGGVPPATSGGGIVWGALKLDGLHLTGGLLGLPIGNIGSGGLAEQLFPNGQLRRGTAMAEKLAVLGDEVDRLEAEKNSLTSQRNSLQARIETLQRDLEGADGDIAAQQAVVDAQEAIIFDLQNQIAVLLEDQLGRNVTDPVYQENSLKLSELSERVNEAYEVREGAMVQQNAIQQQALLAQQEIASLSSQISPLDQAIDANDILLAPKKEEFDQLVADHPEDAEQAQELRALRKAVVASLDVSVLGDLAEDMIKLFRNNRHQIPWLETSGERETRIYNDDDKVYRPVRPEENTRQDAERQAARVIAVFNAVDLLTASEPDQSAKSKQKLLL